MLILILGHDTSMGSARFLFDPREDHGEIVKLLLAGGAVPFMKTNIPQLLLINETVNYIWGRAKNPWDTNRSTGGSSGGEGGLVALGCSPLGIGSDGGGSVRIPANYCGLYGVRPTGKRFTLMGHRPPSSYVPRHLYGCVGPLSKSVDDCRRMLESVQNAPLLKVLDPALPILGWNNATVDSWEHKKLRIGVIRKYKLCDTFKGMDRVMDDVVKKMRALGHEVIEFDFEQELVSRLMTSFIS